MTRAPDPAIEAVTRALADNAITEGSDAMHSWRCADPDRYPGYCTCIPVLVADILTAVRLAEVTAERDALAAKVAAVEELAALWEMAAMPPEQRLGPGYASERLRHALEDDQ